MRPLLRRSKLGRETKLPIGDINLPIPFEGVGQEWILDCKLLKIHSIWF
jgi:hypothetical protein